ncbi:MAG: ABC transporter permease [Rhodospirillaceae bacterium]|nr:ABC transporter permease [Rhodospirillaceae bacterium]
MTACFGPALALAQREILRFTRQKSRVIGGIAQPILIWVFLGSGFSPSFRPATSSGSDYAAYVFPGILLLMLLFSSVFSAMTLIEDRDHGFLQGVLAAPVSRRAVVMGKIGGGAALAVAQGLILLLAAPLAGMPFHAEGLFLALPILCLAAIGFASTGFVVAWSMRSTSGFHAVMMVVLMPAWMLSGALFPIHGVPLWLEWVMAINPLSYGHALLSEALSAGAITPPSTMTLSVQMVVFLGWIVIVVALSINRAERVERGAKLSADQDRN